MDPLKYLAALMAICCAAPVLAQNRAVEELNYQVSGSYSVNRPDDTTWSPESTSSGVGASITIPLAKYLGATLSGGYGRTRTPFDYGPAESNEYFSVGAYSGVFKQDSSDIGIAFFLRDFDIGKVGVGYSRGRGETASYSPERTYRLWGLYYYYSPAKYYYEPTNTNTSRAFADYYFQDWTASVSYLNSRFSSEWGTDKSSLYTLGATYYPLSNLAVGLNLRRQPAEEYTLAENSQALTLEYQPEFLGKSTSFTLQLGNQEYSQSAMVGVTFFFDKRVDLITRDRRYR